jgi:hypothetical protein
MGRTEVRRGPIGKKIIIFCHSCRLPPEFRQCNFNKNTVVVSTSRHTYLSIFPTLIRDGSLDSNPIRNTIDPVEVVASTLHHITNFEDLPDALKNLIAPDRGPEEGRSAFNSRTRMVMKWQKTPGVQSTIPENVLFLPGESFITSEQGIFEINPDNGTLIPIADRVGLTRSREISFPKNRTRSRSPSPHQLPVADGLNTPTRNKILKTLELKSFHKGRITLGNHFIDRSKDQVNRAIEAFAQTEQYVLLSDILNHRYITDNDLVVVMGCNGICGGELTKIHGRMLEYRSHAKSMGFMPRIRSREIEHNIQKFVISRKDTPHTSGESDSDKSDSRKSGSAEFVDWDAPYESDNSVTSDTPDHGGKRRMSKKYKKCRLNSSKKPKRIRVYKNKNNSNRRNLYRRNKNNYSIRKRK